MKTLVSCPMVLGGIVCLVVGLVLGLRSIFVIRQSQGRLQGYPVAVASVLISFFMLAVVPWYAIRKGEPEGGATPSPPERRGRPVRPSGATVSRVYVKLVAQMPAVEWFKGSISTRRIRGAAAVGEDNVEDVDAQAIDRIVERVGNEQFASERVIELTLRNLREKGTDVPIVAWFAEVDNDSGHVEPDFETRGSGEYVLKCGRIYLGVYSERPGSGEALVNRLGDYFAKRLKAIEPD